MDLAAVKLGLPKSEEGKREGADTGPNLPRSFSLSPSLSATTAAVAA